MSTDSATLYNPQDFLELQKLIREHGLLKRSPVYYAWKIASTFALWASSFVFLYLLRDHAWLALLICAPYMAFAYGQIGLLGHDAGHRQIFSSATWNDIIQYPCWFMVGNSTKWWMDAHNNHHAHPNRVGVDADIEYPLIAFCEEQVHNRIGLARAAIRYQQWIFPFILPFTAIMLRLKMALFIFHNTKERFWLDSLLFFLHFVLYFGAVFTCLSWPIAILFVVVHQMAFGLYMGTIFAPNHKGMVCFTEEDKVDFLREQVLTSRNMRGSAVTDFVYGGLNYQIEHHLFPYMARNNMVKAQKIVRDFCQSKGIAYHETSVIGGIQEILSHLRDIARYSRTARA